MCALKCHFALVDKLHLLQSIFLSFSRILLMCFLRSSYSGHILITLSAYRNIIFIMDCCFMFFKLFSIVFLDHFSGVLNINIVYTYHFFHIDNFYVIRFQCLVLKHCKITFIAIEFLLIIGRCQNIIKIIDRFIFIMFIITTLDRFPRKLMIIIDYT